jgi:glutamate carboxypeptidase
MLYAATEVATTNLFSREYNYAGVNLMVSIIEFSPKTDAIINLLTKLVSIESPSTEKPAVDRLGSFIQEELSNLGAAVTVDQQTTVGNNIIGKWNPSASGNGILLLCHMDTVFDLGTLYHRPVQIENNRFYGPGVLDMKASIAIFLFALCWFREHCSFPERPITALFTSDEETGSDHSRYLIENLASRSTLVLCLEPALPDGSLKTARKGTGDIEIVTHGKAAHAGVDHEKGRNAIVELAHHILAVQKLTDYSRGTTVSVGVITGGTRTNVVPDQARALVDFRVASTEEADRIRMWASQRIPVLEGTQVTISVRQDRPPMPRDTTMLNTFQKVQAIANRLGLHLSEGSTGGGSDANFVAPLGIPVIDGLGAVGEGAHSEREFVVINSLAERTALLAAILTEW